MQKRILPARVRDLTSLICLLVLSLAMPLSSIQAQDTAPRDDRSTWDPPKFSGGVPAKRLRIGLIGIAADFEGPLFAGKNLTRMRLPPSGQPSGRATPARDVTSLKEVHAGIGTLGLAGDAEFIVADVISYDERAQPQLNTETLLEALHWMKQRAVQVLIVGFGDTQDELIKDAIADLARRGTTTIVLAPPCTERASTK